MKKGKKSVVSKKRGNESLPLVEGIHFHRHRIIHASLAFDFTTPSPVTKFGLSSDSTGDDSRNYSIVFTPPLDRLSASSSYLTVTHLESKRMDTRICILPTTEDKKLEGTWFTFVTHYVELDAQLNACIGAQLSLTNCQLRGDIATPIWLPSFRLEWFCERELGKGSYVPIDINASIVPNGGGTDVSKQLQGSGAVLSKGIGGITSSRTGKLIGYHQDGGQKEVFNGWKAASVRFGKVHEPIAMLMYMKNHPDRIFTEAGYMSIGDTVNGAMVDGVVSDTAKPVSDTTAPGVPSALSEPLIVHGAIEFKCSRSNCNFEPFHISQCIWEMACGFPYVDLVRYAEIPTKQPGTNIWNIQYECKEIRIYHNQELEDELIKLCKQSAPLLKSNYAKFTELMQTAPYQKMRSYLENMAKECNERALSVPVDTDLLKRLEAYKENVIKIQFDDSLTVHPIMDRIEKRQARIFAAFQEADKRDFVQEAMAQVQDYAELVKFTD